MAGLTLKEYQVIHILTSCNHFFNISVLSYLIARKTHTINKMGHWKHLTWAKVCVFLVLVESWVFVAVSGILMTGVGTNGDSIACSVAAWLCIICTGSAKTLIYAFLVEKIYIVWSSGFRTPRLKTKVYMICGGVLLGFAALLVAFLLGHDSHIGDNSMCILSYTRFLWLSLVAYDVLQTCFLTVMFLWPLYRSRVISPILRDVAKRTWIGALAGLTVGGVNTIILASQGGTESTWVCMNICVIDSTLNALILCWVSGPPSDPVDHFTLPAIDVTNITVGNQWKTSAMYHPTLLTGSPPSRTVAVASNYTASQGRQGIGRPQMMCECGDYENLRINSQEYRKELVCFSAPIDADTPALYGHSHVCSVCQVGHSHARNTTVPSNYLGYCSGVCTQFKVSTPETEAAVLYPGNSRSLRCRRFSV